MLTKLHSIANNIGVTVEYTTDLPAYRQGCYLHTRKLILVRSSLIGMWHDWVLAHELGHAYYGHTSTDATSEAAANEYAARLLINKADYAKAEQLSTNPGDIAKELGVPTIAIRHFQSFLTITK